MQRGRLLLSTVVSAKEAPPASLASGAAAAATVTPFSYLSVDRQAVEMNSAGDVTPSLPDQLTRLQSYYRENACGTVTNGSAPYDSPLFQIKLSETSPPEEVLSYYENTQGEGTTGDGTSAAAPPPPAVASLFSCPELLYLQDPPPIVYRSSSNTPDPANNPQSRKMGHRWQSVFQAPLTVFDDRYGAQNFWLCLSQILYKGAFGFETIEHERFGLQLQGIAVPTVEVDVDFGVGEDEPLLQGEGQPSVHRLDKGDGPTRNALEGSDGGVGAESRSFDLFHFYSNVQPPSNAGEHPDDAPETGEKTKAAKCHIADAQELHDAMQYLQSFVEQIVEREGPMHLILYITFVDVHDPENRRSLCLVRLTDVPLRHPLARNEFRVAQVLEMLVEELALAFSAGASAKTVFEEDEGVQLSLECSRLTMVLHRVLRRNYERFAHGVGLDASDFTAQTHWLLNLPEGVFDSQNDAEPVIRVRYADPTVVARMNEAMERVVGLQEVNMECALPPIPTEINGSPAEINGCPAAPPPSRAVPTLDKPGELEEPLKVVDDFSPRCRAPSGGARRRRSVVGSPHINTTVADGSPFIFQSPKKLSTMRAPRFVVDDALLVRAAVPHGKNCSTLTDGEKTLHDSASVAGRHTKLPLCRSRARATVFMEATPTTLDLPTSTPEAEGAAPPSLFHPQMGIGLNGPRRRRSVHCIGLLFHNNRMRRRKHRGATLFTLI